MTILLMICVCVGMWIYGKEMIYRENPNTTITEKITKSPTRYDFNKNKFNFA